MNTFRINWYDFKHSRFIFNDFIYNLSTFKISTPVRSELLFILNIHRGRWVTNDDLLDFMYGDTDPDTWGDWQLSGLRVAIGSIRKILPKDVELLSQFGYGYKLVIEGEKY